MSHISTLTLLATLLALTKAAPHNSTEATFVSLSHHPNAVCLDGSPAGFYIRPGSSRTFVFWLEGGGLCSHEADCKSRSTTALGSSTGWPSSRQLDRVIQSGDSNLNPSFSTATMVFLPYCTGDVHAGTRLNATADTWGLHFSGHLIVKALIHELISKIGLASADLVVFSGGSAGGMGVIYNADYVAAQIPDVRVLAVPIGGYIFAHANYDGVGVLDEPETARPRDFERDTILFEPNLKDACVRANVGRTWECFVPTTAYAYASTQMVVIEAQTDSTVIFGFSNTPQDFSSPAVQSYVTEFRQNATILAQKVVQSKRDAIFSPCCYMHTGFDRQSPMIGDSDYYDLISRAAFNASKQSSYLDGCVGLNCSANCPNHQ
eukprot:TRINITY_DN7959_c0_g1_i1.p1 TRINITY_DN7959_c0_g1~~TRINITY_DN7959_c0_g1_i1.p1  ORF type:complete len:377 (-),score=28.98 TRINITY_DN7959_c0_g1_i1:225-1355(-)